MSREYENVPRPEIERHYHIKELIDFQERKAQDRNYHRDKEKERGERESLIKEAKAVDILDFYCEPCRKDFKSISIKEIEEDWSCKGQNIAFYRSKCDCGSWVIRLITDKYKDPFWTKSRFLALDRGNHQLDIIQPHETNFNLLYGKR